MYVNTRGATIFVRVHRTKKRKMNDGNYDKVEPNNTGSRKNNDLFNNFDLLLSEMCDYIANVCG